MLNRSYGLAWHQSFAAAHGKPTAYGRAPPAVKSEARGGRTCVLFFPHFGAEMQVAMGKKDPRVDAYIEKAAPFAREILRHLRKVVHAACPDVEETIKWRAPFFERNGLLCAMWAFKKHCAFGFWKGAHLSGGKGFEGGAAIGDLGRFEKLADLPSDKVLTKLVREAVALNGKGVTNGGVKASARKKKAPFVVPAELVAALKKKKGAAANFEAMSPSQKREYADWIAEAKQDATRARRLKSAVEWIGDNKSRNWKYEKAK